MTEQEIRKIVVFIRSRSEKFAVAKDGDPKVFPDSFYNCTLYDRRSQLQKGSREYDEAMDEIYIKEVIDYLDDKKDKAPDEQT